MDAKAFERTVRLGLGRAVLHLRERDSHPYREIILDACLHNKAHDPQIEGTRAEYAMDLLRSSGEPEFYATRIIRSLAEEASHWDEVHRFRIARLLAEAGDQSARQAMRSAFQVKHTSRSDMAAEFIELDGIDGLLFVVRQIGEQLNQDADQWEDDYLLSVASERCGQEAVDSALKDVAGVDRNIKAYLTAVEKNRAKRNLNPRPDPKALTYDDIRSLIGTPKAGGLMLTWAQVASDSDLERAACDLLQETDPMKLRSFLLLFKERPFPLDYAPLFRLAELPDGPVPRHALRVLANLEDEKIRSLAFRFIETKSSLRGYSIDLLTKNFRDGDHATVEAWCKAEADPGIVNDFDRSMRHFFLAHPNSECEARLLTKFYEKEPCAHCRYSVVERLLELGGLTDVLQRECAYDSYTETRDLVSRSVG